MAFPALDRWAEDHGFTARELAMIQPSYAPPPSRRSVEGRIVSLKETITLRCGQHPVPKSLTVKFKGDASGNIEVRGRENMRFAKCFFAELRKDHLSAGGAWDQQPVPFDARVKLPLVPPREVLEARLEHVSLLGTIVGCTPRPGALSRTANVTLRMTTKAVEFDVTTVPANKEVSGF